MSTLVCGGAGYIGSVTARLLAERGDAVVVLDSLERGHREAVGELPLVVADTADAGAVLEAVHRYSVDAVVHFAAYKSVPESMEHPGRYFSNNVTGSSTLVDALADAGVERVVFSSSAAVYGTPARVPVAEDAPVAPESVYGETKAMVERILAWYDRCRGVRSVSLRYFNAAGAWPDGSLGEDWSVTTNLVPVAMKALLGGPEASVFGTDYPTRDGTAVRDYIHVVDLAAAHAAALTYLEGGGATTAINLGTGQGSTVLEVLAAAERAAGRPVPHRLADRRPGDPVAVTADNRRASELLGWQPTRDLYETVASSWAWHSTHPTGFGG